MAANNESILKRLEDLVPSVDAIARALQVDHETASRLHRHNLLRHAVLLELQTEVDQAVTESSEAHAGLMERAEELNQAVIDSDDSLQAEADLVSSQRVNMGRVEEFADKQAGAATIAQNVRKVHMVYDEISIRQVLEDVDLPAVTGAAVKMSLIRVCELIDALMDGTGK